MFVTALVAFAIGGLFMGLLAMGFFRVRQIVRYDGASFRIQWSEFGVVSIVLAAIIIPSVMVVGNALSVAEILSYQQFVNGVEVATSKQVRECREGHAGNNSSAGRSNCAHAYVSGSYSWEERHTREVCTGFGEDEVCHDEVYYTTEWADIYTPYATREHYAYQIDSSMGGAGDMSYTFPDVTLDETPAVYPGSSRTIPEDILRGDPADWTEATARRAAGDPRAVTKMVAYDNYILASGDEVLRAYSADIDTFLAGDLLPDHTANILDNPITGPSRSQADKVSFVGVMVDDPAAWQRSVMRFNAALGMQLQGDLHVVLIDHRLVPATRSVPYTQALKAYWQSETYGKRALAKNGIILVLGVNTATDTIAWADATTGMPFGNELMVQYLRDELRGEGLDPDLLFGTPRTLISEGEATVTLSSPRGVVEHTIFEQAPFKRARMSCADDTCVGFKDLISKIEPTAGQKTWMVVVTSLIALGLWVLVGLTSFVSDALDTVFRRKRSSHPSSDRLGRRDPHNGRNYY